MHASKMFRFFFQRILVLKNIIGIFYKNWKYARKILARKGVLKILNMQWKEKAKMVEN